MNEIEDTPTAIHRKNRFSEITSPGHLAVFDIYSLAWPMKGKFVMDNPNDWFWYSADTPQFLNDLYKQGWEVIILVQVKMDFHTNLNWANDVINELDFYPKVYISRTSYRNMWNYFINDGPHIHPTSFSVNLPEIETLASYRNVDILPPVPKIDLPSIGPLLALTMGAPSSSALRSIADELYQQDWDIIASTGRPENGDIRQFTAEEPDTWHIVTNLLREGRKVLIVGTFPKEESRQRWMNFAHNMNVPSYLIWSITFNPDNSDEEEYYRPTKLGRRSR